MRIAVIAMDEPFFLPGFFDRVFSRLGEMVCGVAVVPLASSASAWKRLVRETLLLYGFCGACRQTVEWGALAVASWLPGGRSCSVAAVAKRHGLPVARFPGVNHPECIAWLRVLRSDVVIAQVPDRIQPAVLAVPTIGVLNKHAALLPKYRGRHPIFWALRHGECAIGITWHLMDEQLDRGRIVAQRRIPVEKGDTVHRLYARVFEIGAELVSEAVAATEHPDQTAGATSLSGVGSYYSSPTREDVRQFRAKGCRMR